MAGEAALRRGSGPAGTSPPPVPEEVGLSPYLPLPLEWPGLHRWEAHLRGRCLGWACGARTRLSYPVLELTVRAWHPAHLVEGWFLQEAWLSLTRPSQDLPSGPHPTRNSAVPGYPSQPQVLHARHLRAPHLAEPGVQPGRGPWQQSLACGWCPGLHVSLSAPPLGPQPWACAQAGTAPRQRTPCVAAAQATSASSRMGTTVPRAALTPPPARARGYRREVSSGWRTSLPFPP